MEGFGFQVWGPWFKAQDLGSGVEGFGLKVN